MMKRIWKKIGRTTDGGDVFARPIVEGTPADRAYSNARRAGRTHPELVEVIDVTDRRHPAFQPVAPTGVVFGRGKRRPNRSQRRAGGRGRPLRTSPRTAPGQYFGVLGVMSQNTAVKFVCPVVDVEIGDVVLLARGGAVERLKIAAVDDVLDRVVWSLEGGRQVGFHYSAKVRAWPAQ